MMVTAMGRDDRASTKVNCPADNAASGGDVAGTVRAMVSPPTHRDRHRGQIATRIWLAGRKPG
jgi:hypothetical protein